MIIVSDCNYSDRSVVVLSVAATVASVFRCVSNLFNYSVQRLIWGSFVNLYNRLGILFE